MKAESIASEVAAACELLGYEVDAESVDLIASKLASARTDRYGGLKKGGAGVVPFVKNRLHDMGLLPPHTGKDRKGFLVIGVFHFFRICESAIGWKDAEFARQAKSAGVKRSPLSRLSGSSPINETARRIAGNGDRPCPYCKRYFRNPAAMAMHITERHL